MHTLALARLVLRTHPNLVGGPAVQSAEGEGRLRGPETQGILVAANPISFLPTLFQVTAMSSGPAAFRVA